MSHTRQQLSPAPRCGCMWGTSKAAVLQGFLELVFVFPFVVIVALSPFLTLLLGFSVLLHVLIPSESKWEAGNISWSRVFRGYELLVIIVIRNHHYFVVFL